MSQHCMRCRKTGSLEESYVNINATSVLLPTTSFSIMREKEASHSHADVSSHVKKIQRLHSISESITATSTIPIPSMCPECLQLLTQMLEKSDARARQEKKSLTSFLTSMPKAKAKDVDDSAPRDLVESYERVVLAMQQERRAIHLEMESLGDQLAALELEEANVWQDINNRLWAMGNLNDARDSNVARVLEMEQRVHTIRRMNVLNDAFYIWHKGPFGTINGFCLGRLARHHIDWNEINAAWGEVALLLVLLSEALDIAFNNYQIVPLGSFSKVIRLQSPTMEYALHGSDKDNFAESLFNLGLTALLQCVAQLGEVAEACDVSFRMPYKISGKIVGGMSILFLRDEETWTKASKCVLTNLKWLLAWCSKLPQGYNSSARDSLDGFLKTT
ncbi:autophagy protein 6 [Aphanomyces cochlioides]|nr:autophagy protein 6 [Aphanomyces cochlioides]